jgi:hypothetical protein
MEEAMSAPSVVSWWPRGPEAKLTITSAQRTEQHPMTDRECFVDEGARDRRGAATAGGSDRLIPCVHSLPKATTKKKDDYKAE